MDNKEKLEIKALAESLEHKFTRYFGLDDYARSHEGEPYRNYGSIFHSGLLEKKGGLYIAIAVVVAPLYFKSINEADKILSIINDEGWKDLKLHEIDKTRIKYVLEFIKKLK